MALEYKITEVPEGLESYYKETDDGFVLDVEGVVETSQVETLKAEIDDSKSKLKEFRQHNITLRKELEATNTDNGEAPNIDSVINDAVSKMQGRLSETEKLNMSLQSQLEEVVLSDRVKDIAIKHGVFESALLDIVSRSKSIFSVKDGKPVPKSENSRDENGELLSPESWLKGLEESAPHLFKPSNGSGATRPVNGLVRPTVNRTATQKIADGLNPSSATKTIM